MSVRRTVPKKMVVMAFALWLGMALSAHGQPKNLATETKPASGKSAPSPSMPHKTAVPTMPDLKGQTPD